MPDPRDAAALANTHLSVVATGAALSDEAKLRLHSQLKNALSAELAAAGHPAGLKPGDKVAISSSVGQSISF